MTIQTIAIEQLYFMYIERGIKRLVVSHGLPRHLYFIFTVDWVLRYSSQLRGELENQIANFETKFPTSVRPNFATLLLEGNKT